MCAPEWDEGVGQDVGGRHGNPALSKLGLQRQQANELILPGLHTVRRTVTPEPQMGPWMQTLVADGNALPGPRRAPVVLAKQPPMRHRGDVRSERTVDCLEWL